MRTIGLSLAVTVLALGCSGRYEVGGMDVPSAGTKSRGDDMTMMAMGLGGSSAAGGSGATGPSGDLDVTCVPAGMPEPLEGPFAEPGEVWSRMRHWFDAADLEPPSPLPETTTYEWAAGIVGQAHASWDDPARGLGAVFLVNLVKAGTTGLGADVIEPILRSDRPLLVPLLTAELSPGRLGIFSQQAWLAEYPAITSRGSVMLSALFGTEVPPPPAGALNNELLPIPNVTRREQLAQTVAGAPCGPCHKLIDPLGASLEHFGPDGELRTLDAHLPVDSSGSYTLPMSGREIHFDDHVGLGKQLVDTCDAHLGVAARFLFIAQALNPGASADEAAVFQGSVERLQRAFIRGGGTYRALLDAYLLSPAVLRP